MTMTTKQTITITIAGVTVAITVEAGAVTIDSAAGSHPVTTAQAFAVRTPVNSSVIASIGYNVIHRTLEIEFHSGKVYQYSQVPSYVYDELMETRSKGSYFSHYIRDKYTTREITR
jgi:hypothetical protein